MVPAQGSDCDGLVRGSLAGIQQWIDFMATFSPAEQQAWAYGADHTEYIPPGAEAFWSDFDDWGESFGNRLGDGDSCWEQIVPAWQHGFTGADPVYEYHMSIGERAAANLATTTTPTTPAN